jgi:hypothetical protein
VTGTWRQLLQEVQSARNADGGWGYRRGGQSRLEPTALCLLALSAADADPEGAVLARWPRDGALLIDPHTRSVNASDNGVALLAACDARVGAGAATAGMAASLVAALVQSKGLKLPPSPTTNRQDNSLQGWSWVPGTFSWVEPTAWCVLALKRWARMHSDPSTRARIAEGERLLIDRVCREGGWNYGNSNVLGKELFAYIPTTALGLLALQNRRDQAAVIKSLNYLSAHCLDERSGLSLSLSRIALGVLGARDGAAAPANQQPRRITGDLDAALESTWHTTQYLGNLAATALALYAAAGEADNYAAFRI